MSEPQPLNRMRRAIAKAMSASAAVPQFSIEMELAIGSLAELRAEIPPPSRPSYIDALVASTAAALDDHSALNSSFTEEGIVCHEEVNVALAVALDDGLISPVIRRANHCPLRELTAERVRLTAAAREGTLKAEEVLSATFTISNLGPLGVRRFNGLVVPPQAGILAVGAIEEGAMNLTLSVDHRLIDGAPAASFLGQVRSQLEEASWLERLFVGLANAAA
jgi:pyruvate dehydrogenase E2 component (dihydrolipoamide acetyltransferase)